MRSECTSPNALVDVANIAALLSDAFYPFQIDHIVSLKHGGQTDFANLAFSCFACNSSKGSDIGSVLLPDRRFIRLFDPRNDRWSSHFELENCQFVAKTIIAEVTIKILQLNSVERIIERQWIEQVKN